MPKIKSVLVTGGSRSGKSSYALALGKDARNPYFIATGWAGDDEMAERIRNHQQERGARWNLIETRTDLLSSIQDAVKRKADFILVDCLTLWVSNLLLANEFFSEKAIDELADYLKEIKIPIVLVTNEVGMGIVPDNALARKYRDLAGSVNKRIASVVETVILTVCGIPMKIK